MLYISIMKTSLMIVVYSTKICPYYSLWSFCNVVSLCDDQLQKQIGQKAKLIKNNNNNNNNKKQNVKRNNNITRKP